MAKPYNFARIVHRLMTDARGWRVDDLKTELELADRTWRKYRLELQDTFEPFWDSDGQSLIREENRGEHRYVFLHRPLGAIGASDDGFRARLAAMYFARKMFGYLSRTPIGAQIQELLQRFEESFRDMVAVEHFLRHVDRKLYVVESAYKSYEGLEDTLSALVHATLGELLIDTVYTSAMGDERSERTQRLMPLSLVLARGALYLLARPVREGDDDPPVLTYAIDRFDRVEVTDIGFDYPSRVSFDPESFFDGHFGIFQRRGGESITVELIFADIVWLKTFLTERTWHPAQRFEELDDGRLRMTFPVSSMDRVWPWIRSFGEDVEVIRPAGDVPMSAAAQRAWRKARERDQK